jgi:hypothetical protein
VRLPALRALIAAGGGAKLSRGQLARLQGGAGDGRTMIDVRSMASVSGLGSRCGQNVDGL